MAELGSFAPSGVDYVGTTEPDAEEGETWLNPETGILSVAYGNSWHSVPPTQVLQEAVTFNETEVSVSKDQTRISDGSLYLGDGDTVSYSLYYNGSGSGEYGIRINPNRSMPVIDYTVRENSAPSSLELRETATGSVLDSVASPAPGETHRLIGQMDQGTEYDLVEVFDTDSNLAFTLDSAAAERDSFDVVGKINDVSTKKVAVPALTGSATVGWEMPSDQQAWDLTTYQATEDSGTVTVDVVDGSGTVLFSDIDPQFDLSTLEASTDVHLRFTLERPDYQDNPSIDYAARRFIR